MHEDLDHNKRIVRLLEDELRQKEEQEQSLKKKTEYMHSLYNSQQIELSEASEKISDLKSKQKLKGNFYSTLKLQ